MKLIACDVKINLRKMEGPIKGKFVRSESRTRIRRGYVIQSQFQWQSMQIMGFTCAPLWMVKKV